MMEKEDTRQTGHPKDLMGRCQRWNMENVGLPMTTLGRRMSGERKSEGKPANTSLPGKRPLKLCMCVSLIKTTSNAHGYFWYIFFQQCIIPVDYHRWSTQCRANKNILVQWQADMHFWIGSTQWPFAVMAETVTKCTVAIIVMNKSTSRINFILNRSISKLIYKTQMLAVMCMYAGQYMPCGA